MNTLEVIVTVAIAGMGISEMYQFSKEVEAKVIETSDAIYQIPKCYKARDFKCVEAKAKLIELSEVE